VREHADFAAFLEDVQPRRCFALSTRGRRCYAEADFEPGDAFLFGPETRGLPAEVLNGFAEDRRLYIPMRPGCRSLNLSNAVALVVYEAWRRNGFGGSAGGDR
jgi:tRNA (cytidine/uridine-2'-O-)-methyltransferase